MVYTMISVVTFFYLDEIVFGVDERPIFMSDQVKEISQHMTKAERRKLAWGSAMLMIPILIIICVSTITPLILDTAVFRFAWAWVVKTVCALMLSLIIALVTHRKWLRNVAHRSHQNFYASTEWAKSQDLKAEDIELYFILGKTDP